nr:immunoglobulin light chain junction region [Macaca mulatta]
CSVWDSSLSTRLC